MYVFVFRHLLRIRHKYWWIIVEISDVNLDVRCVHVGGIGVAYVHSQIKEWVHQGVVVYRLQ